MNEVLFFDTPVYDENGDIHDLKEYTGGGGEGTTNYNQLSNKPQINGITLVGNKTYDDLGLVDPEDVYTKSEVDTRLSTKANASNVYSKSTIDTKLSEKADNTNIGILDDLTTTAKDNLVNAINEVNAKPSGGVDIVTAWEEVVSDSKVPSEKLVKDTLDTKVNDDMLSDVAFTGSYNDLDDKPTIPDPITIDTDIPTTPSDDKVLSERATVKALNSKASQDQVTKIEGTNNNWDSSVIWQAGSYFLYDNKLYYTKVTAPAGTSPTNTNYFKLVNLSELNDSLSNLIVVESHELESKNISANGDANWNISSLFTKNGYTLASIDVKVKNIVSFSTYAINNILDTTLYAHNMNSTRSIDGYIPIVTMTFIKNFN